MHPGDHDPAEASAAAAPDAAAWASYRRRRFAQASEQAGDGALTAADPQVRARCLMIGGRLRHASGDLVAAEQLLVEAVTSAVGPDRVTATAWLGVLRAHQSRHQEALELFGAAIDGDGAEQAAEAVLYTGHVLALAGRPAEALDAADRYAAEVQRQNLPDLAGRGTNFSGWVLRKLGAVDEALDRHHAALELAGRTGADEVAIAAMQDIAEDALERGNVDLAARRVEEAESSLVGDLEFGWRAGMRLRLLQGQVALARGDALSTRMYAKVLAERAAAASVPRYASVARLLGHRATAALSEPVDGQRVEADLDELDRCATIESWRWTAVVGAELHVPAWVDRAAERLSALADQAGDRGPALRSWAVPQLDAWRAAAG